MYSNISQKNKYCSGLLYSILYADVRNGATDQACLILANPGGFI